MALVEARRDVRDRLDAEASQGEREDRQPGDPVGVEVAEHEDRLALLSRPSDPGLEWRGIRQPARVVQGSCRVAEEAPEVVLAR